MKNLTSAPIHSLHTERNVMVPMRDGTKLATDIYRPAHGDGRPIEEPIPTLLVRTSYDKSAPEWDDVWPYYARRGYAFVIQDLRSRFLSEGDGRYFHTCNPWEGDDGYDTVEWIASQSWSNGKVGTLGSSHRAIVQTQLALERPPHLGAMWVEAGPTNIFAHEAREGGAMALQMFGALHLHALDSHEMRDNPEGAKVIMDAFRDMGDWFRATPLKPGETALRVVPHLEKTLFDYYYRGEYDDWWSQKCNHQEPYFDEHADVPIVIAGGWYDNFVGANCDYYEAMAAKNKNAVRLVVGPWCHGGMRAEAPWHGNADLGVDGVWTNRVYNPERLRWFDRWLRDEPPASSADVDDDPPVRIYVMGTGDGSKTDEGNIAHGGYWRSENEWPLARTDWQTMYLHADGSLRNNQPEAGVEPLSYVFDPEHPVPTIGGPNVAGFRMLTEDEGGPPHDLSPQHLDQWGVVRPHIAEVMPAGGFHQKEEPGWYGAEAPYPLLRDRPDVLAFGTAPLEQDTELTGWVTANLWVSSDAPDTDFTVKLVDVYPESPDSESWPGGYHLNLTDTVLRMRYRNSWEKEELMTPGEAYRIEIRLWPTSNVFKAGHRIRIDISSSNFPRFDVNPNTGEPMGRHTHMQKATNSVLVDADHPSSVTLPVIPGK